VIDMGIIIEIITSPNCVHSPKAVKLLTDLTKKMKGVIVKEVSVITPEGQVMAEEYEIESTPSIAINGRLVFEGLPKKKEMKEMLTDIIEDEKEKLSYFF